MKMIAFTTLQVRNRFTTLLVVPATNKFNYVHYLKFKISDGWSLDDYDGTMFY